MSSPGGEGSPNPGRGTGPTDPAPRSPGPRTPQGSSSPSPGPSKPKGFALGFELTFTWLTGGGGGTWGINLEYTSANGFGVYVGTPYGFPSCCGWNAGASFSYASGGNGSYSGPMDRTFYRVGPFLGSTFNQPTGGPGDEGYSGFSLGRDLGMPSSPFLISDTPMEYRLIWGH